MRSIYERQLLEDESLTLEISVKRSPSGALSAHIARDDTNYPGDPLYDLIALPDFPVEIRVVPNGAGVMVTMNRPEKVA